MPCTSWLLAPAIVDMMTWACAPWPPYNAFECEGDSPQYSMPRIREGMPAINHRSTVLPYDRSTLATHIQFTQQPHEKPAFFTCSSCRRLAFWT